MALEGAACRITTWAVEHADGLAEIANESYGH